MHVPSVLLLLRIKLEFHCCVHATAAIPRDVSTLEGELAVPDNGQAADSV